MLGSCLSPAMPFFLPPTVEPDVQTSKVESWLVRSTSTKFLISFTIASRTSGLAAAIIYPLLRIVSRTRSNKQTCYRLRLELYIIYLSRPRWAFSHFVLPSEVFSPAISLFYPPAASSFCNLALLKDTVQRATAILLWSATHNDSVAIAPNMSPSARFQNHNTIECIDLTAESLEPFGEPAVGGDTQMHINSSVHRP